MGHYIRVNHFHNLQGLLTEQEARDLVDVFYRHSDHQFSITAIVKPSDIGEKSSKIRGQHRFNYATNWHEINLFRRNIWNAFEEKSRCGGNWPAPSLRMAAAMVLSHELQHANQVIEHTHEDRTFYGTKNGRGFLEGRDVQIRYDKRPCEQDARRYVDENMDVIAGVLGVEIPPRPQEVRVQEDQENHHGELCEIIELFRELPEVSLRDLVEELRNSGINTPANVDRIAVLARAEGLKVR